MLVHLFFRGSTSNHSVALSNSAKERQLPFLAPCMPHPMPSLCSANVQPMLSQCPANAQLSELPSQNPANTSASLQPMLSKPMLSQCIKELHSFNAKTGPVLRPSGNFLTSIEILCQISSPVVQSSSPVQWFSPVIVDSPAKSGLLF